MKSVDEILKDAEKYRSEKQYELALEKYTEAIASLYVSRGEVFGLLQRFGNQVDDFTTALNMTTDDWLNNHLHFMRGLTYLVMRDYKKAILDLTIAIDKEPVFQYFYLRGCAFESTGDYQRAREDYVITLKMYPGHQEAREALAGLDIKESKA
ncbi:MAG: hypothetical protein FJ110_08110 [Deltaproteobacteria bacterium]|nr:hypothetical protein [Deltaproteobacteria bacterium]